MNNIQDKGTLTSEGASNIDSTQHGTSPPGGATASKDDALDKIMLDLSDLQLNVNAVDKHAMEREEKLTDTLHIMKCDIVSDLLKEIKSNCFQPLKEEIVSEIKVFIMSDLKLNIPDTISTYERQITDLRVSSTRLDCKLRATEKQLEEITSNCDARIINMQSRHDTELKHCREICDAKLKGAEDELARVLAENVGLKKDISDLRDPAAAASLGPQKSKAPSQREIPIKFTDNLNPVLSAFYVMDPPLQYKGDPYRTAEAAYHVDKVMHYDCPLDNNERIEIKKLIMAAESGKEAKEIAEDKIPYNPSWKDAKFPSMACIQREKKRQCAEFNDGLKETEGCRMTHPVGDSDWRLEFPRILEAVRDNVPYVKQEKSVGPRKDKSNPTLGSSAETLLIVDSVGHPIKPEKFASQPVHKIHCSGPKALAKHIAEMPAITPNIETTYVHTGINPIRDGTPGDVVAADICKSLDLLQRKVPNSKLVYSQMIAKPTAKEFGEMTKANELISAHCKAKCMVYLPHKDLCKAPNLFRDDWHPDEIKGGLKKLIFVLKSVHPETEEKQNQRRGFRRRGRSITRGGKQEDGRGGSQRRGSSRQREGSQRR